MAAEFVAADLWYYEAAYMPGRRSSLLLPSSPFLRIEDVAAAAVDLDWFFEDSAVILLRGRPLPGGVPMYVTDVLPRPPIKPVGSFRPIEIFRERPARLTDYPADEPDPRGYMSGGWRGGGLL